MVEELEKLIQSGEYTRMASSMARTVGNNSAEYYFTEYHKKHLFEGLEKLYGRDEIDRIPCSQTRFYYTKNTFTVCLIRS